MVSKTERNLRPKAAPQDDQNHLIYFLDLGDPSPETSTLRQRTLRLRGFHVRGRCRRNKTMLGFWQGTGCFVHSADWCEPCENPWIPVQQCVSALLAFLMLFQGLIVLGTVSYSATHLWQRGGKVGRMDGQSLRFLSSSCPYRYPTNA